MEEDPKLLKHAIPRRSSSKGLQPFSQETEVERSTGDRPGMGGMEEVQNFSIKGHHPKRRQVLGPQTYWSKREMTALDQERGTEGRAGWVGMEVQDFQIKDAKLTGDRFTRGSNLLV